MRDLYNRKARLNYWIARIDQDLDDENDRTDVLKFVEIMQAKDQRNYAGERSEYFNYYQMHHRNTPIKKTAWKTLF